MVMLGWFAPDPTPVLEGPHVVLRAPRLRDYDAWYALRRKSREFLRPFEPRWTEADLNRRAYRVRLSRGKQEAINGSDYAFFLFEKTPTEALGPNTGAVKVESSEPSVLSRRRGVVRPPFDALLPVASATRRRPSACRAR